MYDHPPFFFACKITRPDIRSHVKWAVSLVIAYSYLIILRGLCMYLGLHIHFITSEGTVYNKAGETDHSQLYKIYIQVIFIPVKSYVLGLTTQSSPTPNSTRCDTHEYTVVMNL